MGNEILKTEFIIHHIRAYESLNRTKRAAAAAAIVVVAVVVVVRVVRCKE